MQHETYLDLFAHSVQALEKVVVTDLLAFATHLVAVVMAITARRELPLGAH